MNNVEEVLNTLRCLRAVTQAGGNRSVNFVNIMEAVSDFVTKDLDDMIVVLAEVQGEKSA